MQRLQGLLLLGWLYKSLHAQLATDSLEEARRLWQSKTHGLPTDYTFLLQLPNEGQEQPESVVVSVRNDVVTKVDPLGSRMGLTEQIDPQDVQTVPALFDSIEIALENKEAGVPVVVEATYNDVYGYPLKVKIEYDDEEIKDLEQEISPMTLYTVFQTELDVAKALWVERQCSSYYFSTQALCFCPQDYVSPKRIHVVDDIIVSTVDIETGDLSNAKYSTIRQVFDVIQSSLSNFDVDIEVEYNETFGHPTSLKTNPDYRMADAGVELKIWDVALEVDGMLATDEPVEG